MSDLPAPVTAEERHGRRHRHAARSALLGLVLAALALLNVSGLLNKAQVVRYVEATSERTLASFAVARLINAGISVIQEVEIGVSVGVSAALKPGEVLDPVNDLVERFSLMMLVSATAFWVLRLCGEVLYAPAVLWVLGGMYLVGLAALLARTPQLRQGGRMLHRLTAIGVAVVAFAVLTPVAVDRLHHSAYLHGEYQSSLDNLTHASHELGNIADLSGGWNIRERLEQSLQKAKQVSERVTREFVIQLAVIVLETLLVPLAALWLCIRFVAFQLRRLFAE